MEAFRQGWTDWTDEDLRRAKEQAPKELPQWISFSQLCQIDIPRPAPIIHGLFDQASSMVIGGGSKTFKSWAMSDLAVSITAGIPWWGLGTVKGSVIYCNFELKPYYCRERFRAICNAKRVPLPENLFIWNLRGEKVRLLDFKERLLSEIERVGVTCVFVDPFYKLLGDKDERISSELLPILEVFEEINCTTNASTICAAHFTKGNQAAKDPMDRISGGAALNRHPDCLITLTRHEQDQAFSIDIISRDYPPFDCFVVKWNYPLFSPDVSLDPSKLKVTPGRPKTYNQEQILNILKEHDDEFNTTQLRKCVEEEIGMSNGAFYALWAEIRASDKVFQSCVSRKWNIQS